jgi:hypothetical protein
VLAAHANGEGDLREGPVGDVSHCTEAGALTAGAVETSVLFALCARAQTRSPPTTTTHTPPQCTRGLIGEPR